MGMRKIEKYTYFLWCKNGYWGQNVTDDWGHNVLIIRRAYIYVVKS